MRTRREGVIGVEPTEPTGALYLEAQRILKAKAERREKDRERREAAGVPNYICYPAAFKGYDPKTGKGCPRPLPTCHVCGDNLPPMENHKCQGFTPKYVERTEETKQRWEAKREEIRETRRDQRGVFCTECGNLLEDPEDAEWHFEDHGCKPYREHYALDGEPDGDLEGYDDEPEEDYCEGDDDGYDWD